MEHKIFKRYPIGNPTRPWKQDRFVLSTFSARGENMREVVENLAEAGFNLLEMGWADHEQSEAALRYCEQLDVDLLYQDFSVFGGMQEHHLERHIDKSTAEQVTKHIAPYKKCLGYYVWDEPYVHDQLEEARYQTDLFREADPSRLAFTVAIPSYNTLYTWQNGKFADYLEDYCKTINPEVLSLDYYPIGLPGFVKEEQLDTSLMWCDLGLMRKKAEKYHLPLWFYYQGVAMSYTPFFYFPMTRMMMYAAVMYGAKGLQQFTAVGSTINGQGKKSTYFDEQKRIHAEFRALGNILMALNSKYVFHSPDLLPGSEYHKGLYDEISLSGVLANEALPERVSVGELQDEYGHTYLLVLNRDYDQSKEVRLNLNGKYNIYRPSRVSGHEKFVTASDSLYAALEPGDAVLVRLQDAAEAPYTLEYMLEK